jgi:hypothetical protein
MRRCPTLFTAVLLLLVLGGIPIARGDDKAASNDLSKIQPPGGVPLPIFEPEGPVSVDVLNKVRKRLEAVPKTTSRSGWSNWNGLLARNSKMAFQVQDRYAVRTS